MLDRILRKISPEREEKIKKKLICFCREFYTDMIDFNWESINMDYTLRGLEVKVKETTVTKQVTTKEF